MIPVKKDNEQLIRIVFGAVMAAIICVITLFRIPLGQSKLHFANAMCLLAGLLLGPVTGGLSAGLGSALYDVLFGGYDFLNAAITFVSKFAMAWVAAVIFRALLKNRENAAVKETVLPLILSCVAGALTYVALYMLKTWIFKMYVEPVPANTIPTVMIGKLVPSLINAAFAIVVAPLFYHAVLPALKSTGFFRQLEGSKA